MIGATPWDDIRGAEEQLEREPDKKSPQRGNGGAPHPVIVVEPGKRHIAADQGIAALVKANVPFYQRNRRLQRVARVKAKNMSGEEIMIPGIVSVDTALIARELGRSVLWQRYDMKQKKEVVIDPPSAVAAQILSMVGEDWPFAPLRGIIQCPTLRHDGTLLGTPGYDERTGLILVDSPSIEAVIPLPTRENAEKALRILSDLLSEFPFVDDESKAVALSMMITPVVRGAIEVAPMHLVTKPTAGTGGSYLVDCATMIATGERCAVESMASAKATNIGSTTPSRCSQTATMSESPTTWCGAPSDAAWTPASNIPKAEPLKKTRSTLFGKLAEDASRPR